MRLRAPGAGRCEATYLPPESHDAYPTCCSSHTGSRDRLRMSVIGSSVQGNVNPNSRSR